MKQASFREGRVLIFLKQSQQIYEEGKIMEDVTKIICEPSKHVHFLLTWLLKNS
jgi:hypothetical protein